MGGGRSAKKAQASSANAKDATADLGALRGEVDSSLVGTVFLWPAAARNPHTASLNPICLKPVQTENNLPPGA